MDIIKFDEKVYLNYNGIKSLHLPDGWEELYNSIYLDNTLSNSRSGYFFLNAVTQFKQDWFKVRSLKLTNLDSFLLNLAKQVANSFRLANNWTHFCGLYQIEVSRSTDPKIRPRFHLLFSDSSYAFDLERKAIKLPHNARIELFENYLVQDELETTYFPLSINPKKGDDLAKSHLYFELTEFTNLVFHYLDGYEIQNINSTAEFRKGRRTDLQQNNQQPDSSNQELNHDDINLTDATIISALTHALEVLNPETFKGNDKDIINYLESLFPGQRYLAHSTIKKRWGPGRAELGIAKKEKR